MSFLSSNNGESKHCLSEELETALVLWLTPCDLHQTRESAGDEQSCEEVSGKEG